MFLLVLAGAGCPGRIVDVRPYAAHPDQRLDGPRLLVSWQNAVRTTVRFMRETELDDAFRLPGIERRTANPFLRRAPEAPARFLVFKLTIRNESEYDIAVEPARMALRDETGRVLTPVTRQEMTDYWMGRVAVTLGTPRTWGPQMEAVGRRDAKEKLVVETVYTGGLIPPRGEHAGYVAFRDTGHTLKRADPEKTNDLTGYLSLAGLGGLIALWARPNYLIRQWNDNNYPLDNTGKFLVVAQAGAGLWLIRNVWGWLAPGRPGQHQVQLTFEIVTKASRYGSPLRVAPMEFSFRKVRVPRPPPHDQEYEPWRP